MSRAGRLALGTLIWAMATGIRAGADDSAMIARIERFFATDSANERAGLASQIEADPDFDRARFPGLLHRAQLSKPRAAGDMPLALIEVGNQKEQVTLRVPSSYDPQRAYPLILVFPATDQKAAAALDRATQAIGTISGSFAFAAIEAGAGAGPSASLPVPEIMLALRRAVHTQADRVYLFAVGDDAAVDAAWRASAEFAEQFAGCILRSATQPLPGDEVASRWAVNFSQLPILLCCTAPDNANEQSQRWLTAATKNGVKLPWTPLNPAEARPALDENRWPAEAVQTLLAHASPLSPKRVRQTFCRLAGAHAYWLSGDNWQGATKAERATDPSRRSGSAPVGTTPAPRDGNVRLGEISGEIRDQEIIANRKGVTDLTVWFHDDMVAFGRNVRITSQGETVFNADLKPDVLLCLTLAERTRDFDRLCWAAVTWKAGQRGQLLKAADLK